MKIVLIQPDYNRREHSPELLEQRLIPSYSLVMLAQILESAGHQVKVLDGFSNWAITGRKNENELSQGLKLMLSKEKFDLAGISVYSAVRKEALELARLAKELAPGIKIVLGGPNPTRLGQAMLQEHAGLVEFIVLGGADDALPALVKALETGASLQEIPGLVWRNGSGEVCANSRPLINVELAKQTPVRFDRYLSALDNARPQRAYLVTTRGCKFPCNFCSQLWKKAVYHPAARAIEEARHLIEEIGVSELIFYDDCLGLDPRHSAEIFQAVAGFKRKTRLIGISNVQLLNPLWLNPFKDAGGDALMIGIESGHLKLRRKMNKHLDDKEICQGVEALRKIGFKLGIYTMVGYPSEELSQLSATLRLLEKIAPEQAIATVYDLKPGDMMIEWGIKSLMVQEQDYLKTDRRIINYMTVPELEEAAAMADYLETRFSPRPFLKDHDPSWWILGYDKEKREQLRKKAGEALARCQN